MFDIDTTEIFGILEQNKIKTTIVFKCNLLHFLKMFYKWCSCSCFPESSFEIIISDNVLLVDFHKKSALNYSVEFVCYSVFFVRHLGFHAITTLLSFTQG